MPPSCRWRPVAVTALAAVLACAPLAQAASLDRHPSPRGGGEKVIKLDDFVKEFSLIDVGGSGLSLGDEAVGFSEFSQNGQSVGTGSFVCTVVSLERHLQQCESTLRLAKGDITLQGFAPVIPTKFTLAITGGTGAYREARGYMDGTNVAEGHNKLTVHLSK
ncbi:allene oxide cyclase barrel-like domain-containing protein [Streptomyces sp. NBC_01800]|uniref:allene oxide cyclase barrel-like domain-containing protein n=1 Tax=Streptomyces sp. NBC_01800 TaxID=2975945 RepID=UPI002DDAF628|nr:hypothetical protein [Streptomyces sp. NBC_01800]WSA69956.1 hypothetical protein OIE65_25000 [Streptomyces sp. NBC_01800]